MGPGSAPPESASTGTEPSGSGTRQLTELAGTLGLELTPAQATALLAYVGLLRRWNRVHNLTAVDSDAEVLSHHLLDCLAIVRPLEQALGRFGPPRAPAAAVRFVDAGSGAGLPGIPLAVARPHWQGTLIDAVQKKCAFLQQAQVELKLGNIAVRHARLETAPVAGQDVIVSRAFASLRDFTTLTRAMLKPGGLWIAMKGRHPADELAQLPADVEALETSTLRVPLLNEERHLVVLRPRPCAPSPSGSGGREPGPAGA
jgi:16S rRNA (guanine527-N7)-methyltransferase